MLPPSLVDLLSQRLLAQGNPSLRLPQSRFHLRCLQQLAVQRAGHGHELPPQNIPRRPNETPPRDGHSLRVQQAQKQVEALSDLQKRVAALNDTAVLPDQVESLSQEGPHFHETVLQNIYKDLLASPENSTVDQDNSILLDDTPPDIVQALEERLPEFEAALRAHSAGTGLSRKLQARISNLTPPLEHIDSEADVLSWTSGSALRSLIARLQTVLGTLQPIRKTDSSAPAIPLGLLSNAEWGSLIQACLDANDPQASPVIFDLMKRSGLSPSDEQYDSVLDWFATRGLVGDADSYMSQLAVDVPRERQRDLLVKARVKANRLNDACALVHSFETANLPAPMQSYTRVIQALLSQRGPGSEQQKAQAWDMFSHMRYVAHAEADEFLYNVMIRACAELADPEPERALDLFTEMTVDKNITPTTHTYNAVILTCARSKKFALEAFRLAREMLNSHRDAHGQIPARLQPDKNTFCALLEAAKRMGDLPRARWILAQMTRSTLDATQGQQRSVYIDEKVMTHVFHCYAAYRPPFRRASVVVLPGETSKGPQVSEDEGESPQTREVEAKNIRPRGAPQSPQEVLKEASALWARILEDRQAVEQAGDNPPNPPPIFARVSPTSSLLNAYMAIHYAHSPPSASYRVYTDLFAPLGIQRDEYTFVLALEASASCKRSSEREQKAALSFARDVWKEWRELENGGVSQLSSEQSQLSDESVRSTVDARIVERAWSAMMKILARTWHLHEAMALLREFVACYPPGLVGEPSPSDPNRSTRIKLYAERPIIRLTERSSVPEDRITPFLTFLDLSLLHHRAIAAKRSDDIRYINWVAHAYEGSLRRRRNATLRGAT